MASRTIAFSPVRVEPEVLALFLGCIERALERDPSVEWWFYDDNVDTSSQDLLSEFVNRNSSRTRILPALDLAPTDYTRGDFTHTWSGLAVSRIASIKNAALAEIRETDCELVFLLDADVLINPGLIDHLRSQGDDVISAVYWTRFAPAEPYLPNVWDFNTYSFRDPDSIVRLRRPGHHIVGGLGACTLIHRRVLDAGVDFSPVPIVSMWGEDRSFCVRAAVHGFELKADSCLPPFHVYRAELIGEARAFVAKGLSPDWFEKRWLTDGWEFAIRRLIGRLNAA